MRALHFSLKAWVQFLVRELRSHVSRGTVKIIKNKINRKNLRIREVRNTTCSVCISSNRRLKFPILIFKLL